MAFRVLHHDRCFDGACSASLFRRFHSECIGGADGYEFVGLSHQPGGAFDEAVFGSGENAIVDFRYSRSRKLTWWFDHHQSAFPTPVDREDFEQEKAGGKAERFWFDPDYISCTGLLAKVGHEHFGMNLSGLDELLHWADIIDGARFSSPQQAVEMREPALQLAAVIENAPDGLIPRIIPMLGARRFADIVAEPFVQAVWEPLWTRHEWTMRLMRERTELRDGVIWFDLTDQVAEAVSKFIPYYLYPEATYTIGVTRGTERVKVSVGTNPWTTRPAAELVNIAAICESFGGGGHARVGAISFAASQVTRGQEVGRGIVQELRARAGNS